MSLNDMLLACGEKRPPGTKSKLYWTLKEELQSMPATRADLVIAPAVAAPGDTKIYDEPFAFVATSGVGYWRSMDILVDTGQLREIGEGEIGSLKHIQEVDFFLLGNKAIQQENLDALTAHSGCLIAIIPTQDGSFHVVGDLDNPVFIKPYTGGSGGDKVGYEMSAMANTGYSSLLYNADTHGINITPNP